jgi:hypothetical protein
MLCLKRNARLCSGRRAFVSEETGGEELLITLRRRMFICRDDIWAILLPYIQGKDRQQANDQYYKNDGCHITLLET